MIDANRMDDLARLYKLFAIVPTGLPTLKRSLRDSIIRRGKELNDVSVGAGTADAEEGGAVQAEAKDKGKAKAPANTGVLPAIKWVQGVLDLKDRFDLTWKEALKGDREVEAAINEVRVFLLQSVYT